jgi:HD superfamily phosphodiesterase
MKMTEELQSRTTAAMEAYFGADARRIRHAKDVLAYALRILSREPGDRAVVIAAAILHDIGIPEAQRKHGSAAGKYQEIEGPPVARRIMGELGYDQPTIDHVCRIIANHHSARDIDTPEFRIIWDADWLVNLPEEFPSATREQVGAIIARVFKTPSGQALAGKERMP